MCWAAGHLRGIKYAFLALTLRFQAYRAPVSAGAILLCRSTGKAESLRQAGDQMCVP
ncbi:hypothetical protein MGAST_25010 [Mycobacterium gastri 'Wayne']|nr:hypothetical protein MGAST_25010 [Mycobacterium gastri 'Wayne']